MQEGSDPPGCQACLLGTLAGPLWGPCWGPSRGSQPPLIVILPFLQLVFEFVFLRLYFIDHFLYAVFCLSCSLFHVLPQRLAVRP